MSERLFRPWLGLNTKNKKTDMFTIERILSGYRSKGELVNPLPSSITLTGSLAAAYLAISEDEVSTSTSAFERTPLASPSATGSPSFTLPGTAGSSSLASPNPEERSSSADVHPQIRHVKRPPSPCKTSPMMPNDIPTVPNVYSLIRQATIVPTMPNYPVIIPSEFYVPFVEEAIEIVHKQDAAAKQMKKMRPKKYSCQYCDAAFSNNGQLTGHIRTHTGERPFKCDLKSCGKSFTRNEELTRHKRIHTGVRPYRCSSCTKRFGRKDHLTKHEKTHKSSYHYTPADPYHFTPNALNMLAFSQLQKVRDIPYYN